MIFTLPSVTWRRPSILFLGYFLTAPLQNEDMGKNWILNIIYSKSSGSGEHSKLGASTPKPSRIWWTLGNTLRKTERARCHEHLNRPEQVPRGLNVLRQLHEAVPGVDAPVHRPGRRPAAAGRRRLLHLHGEHLRHPPPLHRWGFGHNAMWISNSPLEFFSLQMDWAAWWWDGRQLWRWEGWWAI